MSYYAGSADDVYRYAFRADQNRSSLTDRFGLSIVFVNDSSVKCRRFLAQHFVDLSYRTADRIRFIFFADLEQSEIDQIALRADCENSGRLGRILEQLWKGRTASEKLSEQHAPWREIMPDGLHPVHPENTLEKLGWERDRRTAVPGLGAALQFAQKLGIGGYVPCFVIFTDIGSPHADVMPISEEMDVNEIYRHVRSWVDDFYASNRRVIERWSEAERDILDLKKQSDLTLTDIRDYRARTARNWAALKAYATTIHAFEAAREAPDSWQDSLRRSSADASLPASLRDEFARWQQVLGRTQNYQDKHDQLLAARSRLQQTEGLRAIEAAFRSIAPIEHLLGEVYGRTAAELERLANAYLPAVGLVSWWDRVPKKRFPIGDYREIRRERSQSALTEYHMLCREIDKLEVGTSPEVGAELVMERVGNAIAARLQEDLGPQFADWLQSAIRASLDGWLGPAPDWLKRVSPPLTLSEIGFSIDRAGGFRKIEVTWGLRELVRKAEERMRFEAAPELEAADRAASQLKENMLAEIDLVAARYAVTPADRQAAIVDFLARLRTQREELERSVYQTVKGVPSRRQIDRAKIRALHEALDRYDEAVASLVYPHRQDSRVTQVPLSAATPDLLDVQAGPPPHEVSGKLRQMLQATVDGESEAERFLDLAQREAKGLTPASTLASSLRACLSSRRLEEVCGTRDLEVEARNNPAALLDELAIEELEGVLRGVRSGVDAAIPRIADRAKYVEQILTSVGADTGDFLGRVDPHAVALQREYDVFLAHNNADDAQVAELAAGLKEEGLRVWLDDWHVPPGSRFQPEIEGVLTRVRAIAVCVGTSGIGRWQNLEIAVAISQFAKRGAAVIPVLLPGVQDESSLPALLAEFKAVRYFGAGDRKGLSEIVWGVTGVRTETPV